MAAAVLGLYLYRTPVDTTGRADAALGSPDAVKQAVSLMMTPQTRHYAFQAQNGGAARGTLIVNAGERHAVVLVDRVAMNPGYALRLWTVRDHGAPVLLTRLSAGVDGSATAEIGKALFEPALPELVMLSIDPPDASAPRSTLLVSHLGN